MSAAVARRLHPWIFAGHCPPTDVEFVEGDTAMRTVLIVGLTLLLIGLLPMWTGQEPSNFDYVLSGPSE
jgi:hypothetical protein